MVVATYTINDKRDEVIDFAGPYFLAGQDILVAKGNPEGIEGPDDLAGKTVCSVAGSTPAGYVEENIPDAELVLVDAYTKCRDALQNGQVDAVTTDNVILSGYVERGAGRLRAGRRAVHRGALRHRRPRGRRRSSASSSTRRSPRRPRTARCRRPSTRPPARSSRRDVTPLPEPRGCDS